MKGAGESAADKSPSTPHIRDRTPTGLFADRDEAARQVSYLRHGARMNRLLTL